MNTNQQPSSDNKTKIKSKANTNIKAKKPIVIDEYDDFLRDLDRLQDFAAVRWQLGGPTWAVVGHDIIMQNKK
jgi:hypothetical protein